MAISDSPMAKMMYRNALLNLSNGVVSAIDKTVLSSAPLPDEFIKPYLTEETDALTVMNLSYNSLSTWIEEAKKANYFSKHFVTLSKMIMSGVATMARGLVTLHARGEDLSQAPMSIQDLIGVGSYHIRKSYLGVLQTSRKNPEIGERLLINQLSWTNTMLRLFKTKEKLETESSKCRVQSSDVQKVETSSSPELPVGNDVQAFEPFEGAVDTLSPLGAISAPCAYSAPQAFGAFGKRHETRMKGHGTKRDQLPGTGDQRQENEEGRMKNEVNSESSDSGIQEQGTRGKDSVVSGQWQENEEGRMKNEANSESSDSGIQELEPGSEAVSCDETQSLEENSSFFPHNSSLDENSSLETDSSFAQDPSSFLHHSSFPNPPPDYFKILDRALKRSEGSEDRSITFMENEIYQLLADPVFCYFESALAEDLKKAIDDP